MVTFTDVPFAGGRAAPGRGERHPPTARVRCVVMLPLLTLVLAVSIAPDAVPTPPPAPPNGTPGR